MEYPDLVRILKKVMKDKKVRQKALADEIGMSESGLKKALASKDGSITRLNQICEALGIKVSDLYDLADQEEIPVVDYTKKQEDALVKSRMLRQIWLTLTEFDDPVEGLAKKHGLTIKEVKKYMLQLERLDLIKIKNNDRIELPWDMVIHKSRGPLIRLVMKELTHELIEHLLAHRFEPNHYYSLGTMKLCKASQDEFVKELKELIQTYGKLSTREKRTIHKSELHPMTYFVGTAPISLS